jgi:hypothetical protein
LPRKLVFPAAIALLAVGLLLVTPLARADGDPASDYLLTRPAFVPPDAGIPAADAARLGALLRQAKARGYPIRVALVSSPADLGSVGVLFGQPRNYARFLGQELRFVYAGRLLVVMPDGLGVARAGKAAPAEQAVVGRLPRPGSDGSSLVSAAITGVTRLAAAAGVVLTSAPGAPAAHRSNANHDRVVIAIVTAAVLLLAGAALAARRRWPRRP